MGFRDYFNTLINGFIFSCYHSQTYKANYKEDYKVYEDDINLHLRLTRFLNKYFFISKGDEK
jgi:hypothetical protein